MFRFMRTEPIDAAGASPVASRVRVTTAPTFVLPMRPLIFVPNRIGCSRPETRPMRRLKNGIMSLPRPSPKLKMSEPSRKNVRVSGKKSGKRVRFVRRVSTSDSAKSVLTESDDTRFEPTRCVMSTLASPV